MNYGLIILIGIIFLIVLVFVVILLIKSNKINKESEEIIKESQRITGKQFMINIKKLYKKLPFILYLF